MKKQLPVFLLFILLSGLSYSQIIFEKGYFINNSDQRIEGLIKNMEWKNNPTGFEYKKSENEPAQQISFEGAKEFGIGDALKFISARVKIDRSSEENASMSSESKPIFHEEQLFLKVIVEGKATLFSYVDGNLTRYFYKMDDAEIKQLVFKSYLISNENRINNLVSNGDIAQNMAFRQQLVNDLKCEALEQKDFEFLNYNKKELKNIFSTYNESTGAIFTVYDLTKKRDWFDLSLRPGLNCSNLNIQNYATSTTLEFPRNYSFRFGLEAQFILPFNKNKWSIIVEPAYQYFNSELITESDQTLNALTTTVKYQSIQLAAGIRHSFFLNSKSKIFLNLSYVHDFSFNSSITQGRGIYTFNPLDIKPGDCFGMGAGYQFKNRYGIELRYNLKRNLLQEYMYWGTEFTTFAIILDYSIL